MLDHDAGVDHRKNAVVGRCGFATAQIGQPRRQSVDFGRGNPNFFAAFFRLLLRVGAQSIDETRLLSEKILFELRRHARTMLIDGCLDSVLLIGGWIVEICFEPAGYRQARIFEAAHEELESFIVIKPDTELAIELAYDLHDLGGVAHG
jgi:hypothetical protein